MAESKITNFYLEVDKAIDIVVIGDINLERRNDSLVEFMTAYNLSNLIKEPTCYQAVNNPTSIDLTSHSIKN